MLTKPTISDATDLDHLLKEKSPFFFELNDPIWRIKILSALIFSMFDQWQKQKRYIT